MSEEASYRGVKDPPTDPGVCR